MKEYFLEIFKKNSKEINNLYGIRAIGCYLVILFHCFVFSIDFLPKGYAGYLHNIQNLEFLMCLFFVISAFLLSTSFTKELEKSSFFESWKSFVVKRSLRIFPAFYVLLSITILIMAGILKKSQGLGEANAFTYGLLDLKLKLSYWWTDFSYLSNYFPKRILVHGWSLSMEEQFYLAMPIVFLFYTRVLKNRNQKISFLIFLLGLPILIRYYYYFNSPMDIFDVYVQKVFHPIHTHFEPFVYGILLMELWKADKISCKNSGEKTIFYIVFIVSILMFFYVASLEFSNAKLFFIVYRISFYSFFAFVIVFGAIGGFFSKISWFLANPILVFIGKLSYGIYLVHMLVNTTVLLMVLDHKIIENNDVNRLFKASFISLFVSVIIALLSYWIIEKPFLKIREWSQARFDISTNTFYYVKGNAGERVLVSLLLTIVSFFPYIIIKQMIVVDFIPEGNVASLVVWICLALPILINAVSLFINRKLFFYYYLSRFQE